MGSVLMSIKPEYVNKILLGEKIFEFRTILCKKEVTKMYIYSTFPVKKVIGEATIEKVLINTPENIWEQTKQKAGIKKEDFFSYFSGKEKAIAYQLKDIIKYKTPKELSDFGINKAPQSYQYID